MRLKAGIFQEAQEYQANISHRNNVLGSVTVNQSERVRKCKKNPIPFLTNVKVMQRQECHKAQLMPPAHDPSRAGN